jgi:hypothetical protein
LGSLLLIFLALAIQLGTFAATFAISPVLVEMGEELRLATKAFPPWVNGNKPHWLWT